jgi:hypothetical protein
MEKPTYKCCGKDLALPNIMWGEGEGCHCVQPSYSQSGACRQCYDYDMNEYNKGKVDEEV